MDFFSYEFNKSKSLFQSMEGIYKQCVSYIKLTDDSNKTSKIEISTVSNFIRLYDRIKKEIKHKYIQKEVLNKNNTIKMQYEEYMKQYVTYDVDGLEIDNYLALLKLCNESIGSSSKETDKETDKISFTQLNHIRKELLTLTNSLIPTYQSSIFHRYYTENFRFHDFIITGPENTPYDSGCFLFRLYCTKNYPNVPPKVHIYTTGNGQVRFNPNLYNDGTVCLSLLGTWGNRGDEGWIPKLSTINQIMISIQSMIFVEQPYFNEPGYESDMNTAHGIEKSKQYNQLVRLNCMKYAMIDQILNPSKHFEDVIKKHFIMKRKYIINICKKWVDDPYNKTNKMHVEYKQTYDKLCNILNDLTE
jgi:ubiquitin-protein ligase